MTSSRTASADLAPGTRLRWTGERLPGQASVVVLDRRKERRGQPGETFFPGWWVKDGGGLADFVLDADDSLWEVIEWRGGSDMELTDTVERPKLALRPRKPLTSTRLEVGEVRYLHNGTRVLVLGFGWSYNGYFHLPIGTDAAVAVDCGYVWDPRTINGSELLTAAEYVKHARRMAHYCRYMAGVRQREARSFDTQADLLLQAAEALDG